MTDKNRSVPILILFFVVILVVPVYWIVKGDNAATRSVIEARKLEKFSLLDRGYYSAFTDLLDGNPKTLVDVIYKQFLQRDFQVDFENATSDQFPFREFGIQISALLDRQAINLAYAFLPDPAIPTRFGSDIFILRDKSRFIIEPVKYNDSVKNAIDERVENYTYLINKYPEINFFALYFERLENSAYNPINPYHKDADRGRAFLYFEENLPEGLHLAKMMLKDYEDFNSNYYSTDHHWNIHGDIKAYDHIYKLLKSGYPEISAPVEFEGFYTFPDINYLGTTARLSLYPIEAEPFEVALYDLPPFKTYEAGKEIKRNNSLEYMNGNYNTKDRYTDHFVKYFGHVSPFIEYVFDSNPDRNLLLIGKSFSIPLEPLIASHYRRTYVVDFRYSMDFSLSDFLVNHKVDDILIIGDNDVLFDNYDWLIHP